MDSLDMQILRILLDNCRESDRQIGKKLGISGGAAKSRIDKMLRNGTIEGFSLRIEPPLLGYGVFYVVATGRDYETILEQIRLVGRPFVIVPCIGGITICGIVVKGDVRRQIELTQSLMKDVRVLNIFEAGEPDDTAQITKTDIMIIDALMDDPRQNIEVVAKKTDLSTKTVTKSIEKLQRNEAIQFTLTYEPTKLDGYISYVVLAWVSTDIEGTLKRLQSAFSTSFMQTPYVVQDQIVLIMYSNDIFKVDDMVQKVRGVQGVDSADLFIPKKILFPHEWARDSIKEAIHSPTLHLTYQTNYMIGQAQRV